MTTATLTTLFTFLGSNGADPTGGLLIDAAGDLFGTTHGGGVSGLGTVFELPAGGGETTMVRFSPQTGSHPDSGLIADASGDLFGTTNAGGEAGGGTVYEIVHTAGIYLTTPVTLASFSSAVVSSGPAGGLVADAAGDLFGTTSAQGTGFGTVFEILKTATGYASTPLTLASFSGTNGSTPNGGLFIDAAGNLIGTTAGGGANPNGTVFEIPKVGDGYGSAPLTLVSFNGTNGANPNGGIIADASGNLYGTTERGGADALNDGTVFEIAKAGTGYAATPTLLVNFDLDDGAFPSDTLVADAAGNLYGTTQGGGTNQAGTVFEVAKTATGFATLPTTLVNFSASTGGSVPVAGLIGSAGGNLYGTTTTDALNSAGTVFEVTGSGFRSTTVVVAPSATAIAISPTQGDLVTGQVVTFTVAMSSAVTVSSSAPSLTLNDGGNAAYDAAHSTGTSLVFDYTVQASDSTTTLAVTALGLHGATIADAVGDAAVFTSVVPTTFSGVEVNIPAPAVASVVAVPGAGNVQTGTEVTLTVTMTEPVTVAGGVPDLTLNDGGTATYDAAGSTGTTLAFDYTAQASDSTTALAVTGLSANGATIVDALANTADFAAVATTFTGLAINSVLPSVLSLVASPGAGDVTTAGVVTMTATMSAAVIVSGGTPTLTLNDGGSATYDPAHSTGTSLVFDYTVLAAQSTLALAATAYNANGAKVADALGNAAVMTGAVASFAGLGVNIPAATVLSVAASPAAGDVMTGSLVTVTLTMSKPVTVTAGAPALTLNDGGSATYDPTKSSATALVFDYFAQTGQSTTALAVTGYTANGAVVQDATGVAADFTAAARNLAGLEINIAVLTPPTISGTMAGQATTDTAAIAPFANVTVTDQNAGQSETLTVTLSTPSNGTLTNIAGGAYNPIAGVYTVLGSPTTVTAALEGLVFTPTAQQSASGQTVTTTFSIAVTDTAAQSASNATTSVVTTETAASATGVLGVLDVDQQLELIYVAYFDRAADSAGDTFWTSQNGQAQASGQSASMALTNIANSFEPQPETIALYPFLGGTNINLADPAELPGLTSFIGAVYENLFGHAADPAGSAYWVSQITGGTVGLGAAALAIANGATGSDATELRNKIAVAQDFTTRTTAAGLGVSSVPATLIAAARAVLEGVDGTSLNDASVITGMDVTSAYLSVSAATTKSAVAASAEAASPLASPLASAAVLPDLASVPANSAAVAVDTPAAVAADSPAAVAADTNLIIVAGSNQLIDPAAGSFTIQFLSGAVSDTVVLHTGDVDRLTGFDVGPAGSGADTLDLRALLTDAGIDPRGDFTVLSTYFTVHDQAGDALLAFDPSGSGGGATVAVLQGLGGTVTGLDTLIAHGSLRIG